MTCGWALEVMTMHSIGGEEDGEMHFASPNTNGDDPLHRLGCWPFRLFSAGHCGPLQGPLIKNHAHTVLHDHFEPQIPL